MPAWSAKTAAMWAYWLIQSSLFSQFLSRKKSTDSMFYSIYSSSLFLATSVLFLQTCLHGPPRLWQCGCIDSIQAIFVMKSQLTLCSTLSTLAASSSRLLGSSSKRACMVRQDCSNVDVLIDSIQPLFSVLVKKSQLTLCSTLSTLAASSSRLLCSSSKRACMVRQDCSNVDVLIDSIQTLFAVLVMKSQLTLCSTLSTLSASSSRLLCSSSKRACMVRQDCSNVDVLIDSIQTLFAVLVMKSQLTLCSTLSTL